ncbi:MAG: hypothetical protein U5L06_14400 [Rhodovibrio sp.]|nr:hypothetical protein [Rhodovibrio sp.]
MPIAPVRRGSTQVAPTSGKKPIAVSGIAAIVRSPATRWLPCIDKPRPPPMVIPSIQAT